MKLWQDPGFRRQAAVLSLLALAGGAAGFALSLEAGILALALCAAFFLLTAGFSWRRYKTMEQLCQDLDRLLHGNTAVNLDAYTEGAWSVLHSQLTKLIGQLLDQADLLAKDKVRLSGFLADISHQIRTPLTALNLLGAQLAGSGLPEEKRRQAGRELRRQLERLDWLVSALLRMSRLDAGVAQLRREPVDLAQAVEQAAAPLAIAMELAGQTLRIQGQGQILGDLSWTTEALGNIFKNCMEHTPAGGCMTAELSESPLYTQLIIWDTGSGIDPEDLPHLFDRFYRGKNAAAQSVGIGLSLARMILTAQNATIQAANRIQGGAQFLIRFYKSAV